jgi:hypothetical protein
MLSLHVLRKKMKNGDKYLLLLLLYLVRVGLWHHLAANIPSPYIPHLQHYGPPKLNTYCPRPKRLSQDIYVGSSEVYRFQQLNISKTHQNIKNNLKYQKYTYGIQDAKVYKKWSFTVAYIFEIFCIAFLGLLSKLLPLWLL